MTTKWTTSQSAISLAAMAAAAAIAGAALADEFPSKPVELVCATQPGSGAAISCNMIAEDLKKPDYLGAPVNAVFKSAGSNHEPAVYVNSKPADAYAAYMEKQPHVIPHSEDDRETLSEDFHQSLDDTRDFMVDKGMIEG